MIQQEMVIPDALQAAGNVYHLIMENERVRVMRVAFSPGQKAPMHHHPDHSAYVIKGGKITITPPSGKADTLVLEQGTAVFMNAQNHEAMNVGNTDIELIVTELKGP